MLYLYLFGIVFIHGSFVFKYSNSLQFSVKKILPSKNFMLLNGAHNFI